MGSAMGTDTSKVVAAADAGVEDARVALEELVRIPSISADEHRHIDVQHSADATASYLHACGLENVHQATVPGCPPAVIGEWLHAEGAPTILLYAHHDVQPPGFLDHWTSHPCSAADARQDQPGGARRPPLRPGRG